jgi:hypothetical protein
VRQNRQINLETLPQQTILEFLPKQAQLLDEALSGEKDILLYGGAIRGGKTFAALGAIIWLCKMYPQSKWAVVRTDLQKLKQTTIPSFHKICPSNFLKSFNHNTNTVTFTNGSQIIFFGENYNHDKELNRWRGLEVNGFLLEEANELQEKTFYKAIERAGSHNITRMPPPIIICTCNPSQNWVKEKFYGPWKKNELNPRWSYIPAKITDNPYVDERYKENLKNMPRFEYKVFVEGDWDILLKTGVEFYKEFNIEKHVKPLVYNPKLPLWLSFDENVHPYFAASLWQVNGKKAMQVDEFCMKPPRNTVRDMISEFYRRYPYHRNGLLITGDATSKKQNVRTDNGDDLYRLIQTGLSDYKPQLRVPPSNPAVFIRGQFINNIFCNQTGGIEIIIGENCKNTILDLQNVKQAADDTKLKVTVKDNATGISYQEWGHLSDCMDYAIIRIFSSEFETFRRGGRPFTFIGGKITPKQSW